MLFPALYNPLNIHINTLQVSPASQPGCHLWSNWHLPLMFLCSIKKTLKKLWNPAVPRHWMLIKVCNFPEFVVMRLLIAVQVLKQTTQLLIFIPFLLCHSLRSWNLSIAHSTSAHQTYTPVKWELTQIPGWSSELLNSKLHKVCSSSKAFIPSYFWPWLASQSECCGEATICQMGEWRGQTSVSSLCDSWQAW